MRVITVTRRNEPFAILRARDAEDAVATVRSIHRADAGPFAAREPTDAEMIDWLTRPEERVLVGEDGRAVVPLDSGAVA